MTRRTSAAASAAVATLATLGACTGTDDTSSATSTTDTTTSTGTTTPASSDPTDSSSDKPIDLQAIPDESPLQPGTYAVPLLFKETGSTRAVVDVPEGYIGYGSVIGSADGDLAFWGTVEQVDTDPCLGGEHVDAGSSVHDLVTLLVAQRHMTVSKPTQVTIGGYHGVHVTLTAPADIHRCRDEMVTLFAAGDNWLSDNAPEETFDEWILDVAGQRVVGGARILPDAVNGAELSGMVESAEFSNAG